MADAFDQFQTLLREHIGPAALDLQLEDDDPSWNMMSSFAPETTGGKRAWEVAATSPYGEYPSGYEARYEIKVQSGGRVTGGTFIGNTLQMMGKDSHLAAGQAADARYLDPTLTPLPGYIEIRMILKRLLGSVTINHQQVMADLATKPVDEVAGQSTVDAVKRFRSVVTNAFYGDGTASLAQVNNASGVSVVETAGGAEVALDAGTFGRFMMGDVLVAGTHADPRVQAAGAIDGHMVVVNIDADARTIYLQAKPGEGTISLTDNDHLMYADMYDFNGADHAAASRAPNGAESLIIATGTFPGSTSPTFQSGLDVEHHSVLMGFVSDTTSTPENPTMDALTLLLDKILDAGKNPPTAMIGERSLWTYHSQLERENHGMIQVPMGATFQAAGGVAGPILSHMEHRFQKFSSIRVREGSVLGISPSTWRRFVPLGDRTLRWVYGNGPLSGMQGIFGPVYQGPQLIELADAPFNAFIEFGCVDPRANLRRIGLKTQRDV